MDEVFDKIKEYANFAKDEAVKITKTVSDKTTNVVSQTKLKFAISKTEDKIKEIYAQMGGEIYEVYLKGTDTAPNLNEQCEKLDSLYKEIEDMEQQLNELRSSVKCESCGAYNPASSEYCSKCGSILHKEDESAADGEAATVSVAEQDED